VLASLNLSAQEHKEHLDTSCRRGRGRRHGSGGVRPRRGEYQQQREVIPRRGSCCCWRRCCCSRCCGCCGQGGVGGGQPLASRLTDHGRLSRRPQQALPHGKCRPRALNTPSSLIPPSASAGCPTRKNPTPLNPIWWNRRAEPRAIHTQLDAFLAGDEDQTTPPSTKEEDYPAQSAAIVAHGQNTLNSTRPLFPFLFLFLFLFLFVTI
jgi:hypothetical protein